MDSLNHRAGHMPVRKPAPRSTQGSAGDRRSNDLGTDVLAIDAVRVRSHGTGRPLDGLGATSTGVFESRVLTDASSDVVLAWRPTG